MTGHEGSKGQPTGVSLGTALRKEVRWTPGDVFRIPLADTSVAYGQVLHRADAYATICALFGYHEEEPRAELVEIVTAPVQAVVCVGSEALATGRWPIIGRSEPVVSHRVLTQGEREWSRHHRILPELAQGLFGLMEWNPAYDECLRPGSRPPKAPADSRG